MAQLVKALTVEPDDVSSVLQTHTPRKGREREPTPLSCPLTSTRACTRTRAHTHTHGIHGSIPERQDISLKRKFHCSLFL